MGEDANEMMLGEFYPVDGPRATRGGRGECYWFRWKFATRGESRSDASVPSEWAGNQPSVTLGINLHERYRKMPFSLVKYSNEISTGIDTLPPPASAVNLTEQERPSRNAWPFGLGVSLCLRFPVINSLPFDCIGRQDQYRAIDDKTAGMGVGRAVEECQIAGLNGGAQVG
jgi:hypothetical protein